MISAHLTFPCERLSKVGRRKKQGVASRKRGGKKRSTLIPTANGRPVTLQRKKKKKKTKKKKRKGKE